MFTPAHRVPVTVVENYEIDAAGIASVLEKFTDRIQLVADKDPLVEVLLYGLHELRPVHDEKLHGLLRSTQATVIALGWQPDGPATTWAVSCGVDGYLSKTCTGVELVNGIERIATARGGRRRILPDEGHCHSGLEASALTRREIEVLALITRGLSNGEVAGALFLSINSIKSYIRTAYQKIGVTRRTQAVAWGLAHGLDSHQLAGVELLPAGSSRE